MIKRFFYRRAMFRAIRIACYDPLSKRKPSKTYGLRTIKSFERVNGMKFNPFNETHIDRIAGMASHEALFRAANKTIRELKLLAAKLGRRAT
jgi:hypothetical protein